MAAGDVSVAVTNPVSYTGAYFKRGTDQSNYIEIAGITNSIFSQTGKYTVSLDFFLNSNDGNYNVLWNFQDGVNNRHMCLITGNNVGFNIYNGSYTAKKKYNLVVVKRWFNVICCNNGGVLSLYVNGVAATAPDADYASGNAVNKFRIGYANTVNNSYSLNGLIKNVRVWNRVLDSNEISNVYNNVIPTKDLKLQLPLTSDLNDTSGNANNATNGGTVVVGTTATSIKEVLEAARTGATDKYLITEVNGKVMTAVINET